MLHLASMPTLPCVFTSGWRSYTHLQTVFEDVAGVGQVVFLFLDLLAEYDDLLEQKDSPFLKLGVTPAVFPRVAAAASFVLLRFLALLHHL